MVIARLSLFFFLSISLITNTENRYTAQANQWAKTLLSYKMINEQDIRVMANLLYYSYWRSQSTLITQEMGLKVLDSTWKCWQNITHTRMNPSIPMPYPSELECNTLALNAAFDHEQLDYHHIGQIYAHIAELAIKKNYLSPTALSAANSLRGTARDIMVTAFFDIKESLGPLFFYAWDQLRINVEALDTDDTRFDLAEAIGSWLSPFAKSTFIPADKAYNQTSQQAWEILFTATTIHNKIWHAIESARAEYYKAHYNAFMKNLNELKRIKEPLTLMTFAHILSSNPGSQLPDFIE